MELNDYSLNPIGFIRSELKQRKGAPRQGDENAPDAWIDLNAEFVDALDGMAVGDELYVFTWLHQANRGTLRVHPRSEPTAKLWGVFSTRSPDRPNPIGLHPVTVLEIVGTRLKVGPIEAIDGTPVVDIKPVLPNRECTTSG